MNRELALAPCLGVARHTRGDYFAPFGFRSLLFVALPRAIANAV